MMTSVILNLDIQMLDLSLRIIQVVEINNPGLGNANEIIMKQCSVVPLHMENAEAMMELLL